MSKRAAGTLARRAGRLFYTFDEVYRLMRPMGPNQVYNAFRNHQIPGGQKIGRRWYAVRKVFDREYRGEAA